MGGLNTDHQPSITNEESSSPTMPPSVNNGPLRVRNSSADPSNDYHNGPSCPAPTYMSQLTTAEQNVMKEVLGDVWQAVRNEVPKQAGLNENLSHLDITINPDGSIEVPKAIFQSSQPTTRNGEAAGSELEVIDSFTLEGGDKELYKQAFQILQKNEGRYLEMPSTDPAARIRINGGNQFPNY